MSESQNVESSTASTSNKKGNGQSEHSTFGIEKSTAKDRIKTPSQFQTELDELVREHLAHKALLEESKKSAKRLKNLRARVLPFMVHNMQMQRADSEKHGLYLSSTVVSRFRKVRLADVYNIIEQELGPANLELIKQKAAELRRQKVQMRQTSFRPISKKRKRS